MQHTRYQTATQNTRPVKNTFARDVIFKQKENAIVIVFVEFMLQMQLVHDVMLNPALTLHQGLKKTWECAKNCKHLAKAKEKAAYAISKGTLTHKWFYLRSSLSEAECV